ncbi:MAG: sulfur carrier protein ThiS [Chloroflexota bacterium]|nr:sulfur carrier protein ThiS [Chloroflexota bacterium]MDE2895096.1 sulfur carrier protein ThiS [Chloroflexota bacterium]
MSEAQPALTVTLNGEAISIDNRQLTEALCEFGYDPEQPGIAVAINMSVVPRSEWGQTSVADGDRIDIVGAKQGG